MLSRQGVQACAAASEQLCSELQPLLADHADRMGWGPLADCVEFICMRFARRRKWALFSQSFTKLLPSTDDASRRPKCMVDLRVRLSPLLQRSAQEDFSSPKQTAAQFTTEVHPCGPTHPAHARGRL